MDIVATIRLVFTRACAAGCLFACLPASVASAGIQPEPFRTGLFGVVAGQSIRVSILNAGHERGIIVPCVHVWNAAGELLFAADAGPLLEGAGVFADFTPPPVGGVPGGTPARGRTQVFAEVVVATHSHPPDPAHPPEPVHPPDPTQTLRRVAGILVTLEVFDAATGRTAFTSPFAAVAGIEPEPFRPVAGVDPTPFRTGLFGVKESQSIRVSVLNAGPVGGIIEPCFRVFDLAGVLLSDMDAGPIPGGGGVFQDFELLPPGPIRVPGFRTQVRVEVDLVPAVDPPEPIATPRVRLSDFHLTLEVFDTATGQTVYTMPLLAVGFNPQPEPPEPIQ